MKIAVPFEDGYIFQHFGKTKQFKIYEVQEGNVVSSDVLDTNGSGHGALAGFLAENNIAAVICGGIGDGAMDAMTAAGISVFAGNEGSSDEAVSAFLRGELTNTGAATCDHHDHEEHSCGENGCGSDCGGHSGGCGGCGGGCGSRIVIPGRNSGKSVKVHYCGTFNDGTVFDSSYERGEPLAFICGAGMMIPGFDAAVVEMDVGQILDIHLMPEEAYGAPDPSAIFTVPIQQLPGSEELSVGARVYLYNDMGQPFPASVTAKDNETITFDANHEMAGKELNFRIELLSVE